MLQNQCELWSGPIAAVAYMPLLKGKLVSMDDAALNGTTVEEQKAKLALFYKTVSHAGQHAVHTNIPLFCQLPCYSHSMLHAKGHLLPGATACCTIYLQVSRCCCLVHTHLAFTSTGSWLLACCKNSKPYSCTAFSKLYFCFVSLFSLYFVLYVFQHTPSHQS